MTIRTSLYFEFYAFMRFLGIKTMHITMCQTVKTLTLIYKVGLNFSQYLFYYVYRQQNENMVSVLKLQFVFPFLDLLQFEKM